MNTQAWEFTVIAGTALDKLKKANVDSLLAGATPAGFDSFEGKYRERQVTLAMQLFSLMGIGREDKKMRNEWMMRGFRYFDAPALIIISKDKSLGPKSYMDIGIICQSICLAALHHGLGTCIQGQGIMFPDEIRKHTGMLSDKEPVIAITIGYPDMEFPANKLVSDRVPAEEITAWLGFDD
jgi:nitroreductase